MTLIVAHRGASQAIPENTMEAFQAAVEAGADAIELDVHLTADGELAVIHDPTLDRTTDRTTTVATATMADIREADAGWAFLGADSSYPFRGTGMTVPTLPEVLAWLPAGNRAGRRDQGPRRRQTGWSRPWPERASARPAR